MIVGFTLVSKVPFIKLVFGLLVLMPASVFVKKDVKRNMS